MSSQSRITAYRKMVDRGFPGPVVKYFYVTEYDGAPWIADIDYEVAEGYGGEFEWDDEPCGHGIRAADIPEYLEDADEIGYIDDDRRLHITKRWRVPAAYGYKADMTPVVTSWDVVGKGSSVVQR